MGCRDNGDHIIGSFHFGIAFNLTLMMKGFLVLGIRAVHKFGTKAETSTRARPAVARRQT